MGGGNALNRPYGQVQQAARWFSVRDSLKEAGLQNPVLTPIRAREQACLPKGITACMQERHKRHINSGKQHIIVTPQTNSKG